MRTLFGHGTPRQAADAVLLVIVVALWKVLQTIAGRGERLLGMLLPHATVNRPAMSFAA
jgi:hypothetical protein